MELFEGKETGDDYAEQKSEDVEKIRLSVIDQVRRENPHALKDPRANEDYLMAVASAQAIRLRLPTGDLVKGVVDDILGYGPLQRFIFPTEEDYKEATEVMIPRFDLIYVEVEGALREVSGAGFRDQNHFISLMRRMAASAENRIDLSRPFVKVRLPDGSRACMFIPPVGGKAHMTVRRFPRSLTWKDLMEREAITEEALAFLKECASGWVNVLFTGGMGSGKTTDLNCFISLISETNSSNTSVVSMEDVPELQPQHKNLRQVFSKPSNLEGKGGITLAELAETALLAMRPDWIVWAELHGSEAYYGIQMSNLGHPTAGTVHSNSAVDAFEYRLPGMYRQAKEARNMTDEEVRRQIKNAFDVAYHCARVRLPGGKTRRQVVQVAEVISGTSEPRVLFELDRKSLRLQQVAEPWIFKDKDKRRWW